MTIRIKHADEMPQRDITPEHTKRAPVGGGPNHPDVTAAVRYVESVADTSDFEGVLAWHGWALREAFLAGCSHAIPPRAVVDLVRESMLNTRAAIKHEREWLPAHRDIDPDARDAKPEPEATVAGWEAKAAALEAWLATLPPAPPSEG